MPGGARPAPDQDLDPYGIWIAEVMLQQTQLAVALPYWTRWMEAFPSVESLAAASLDEVRLQWQGLGYYSRVRRLHEAAQLLVDRPWPRTLEGWMALPGIGVPPPAASFPVRLMPLPILDGNVKRVLARLTAHPRPPARDDALFWCWSEALLDPVRPRDTNQALMDLGATLCTPPAGLPALPLAIPLRFLRCRRSLPLARDRSPQAPAFQVIGVGVVLNAAGEVLIDQRLEEGLLGGMWEFPGGKQEQGETIETCSPAS